MESNEELKELLELKGAEDDDSLERSRWKKKKMK